MRVTAAGIATRWAYVGVTLWRNGDAYQHLRAALGFTLALAGVALVMAPAFSAGFGAIDDHEIPGLVRDVADQGLVAIGAHAFESNGRFRPVYWVARVTEAAVWGTALQGWYFDRLLLLVGTLVGAYLLARLWVAPTAAGVAALLVVAGPQAQAFTRLGPQEAYAVPLMLAGSALVGRRRSLGLVLLVVAAFTKEAFIVAPVIGAAWAWIQGVRAPAVAAGAASAIAAIGVGVAVLGNGGDYYRSVRSIETLGMSVRDLAVVLAGVTAWPLAMLLPRKPLLVGAVLVAWQAVLLAGVGLEGRYLYPLVAAAAIGVVVAVRDRPLVLAGLALLATANLWNAHLNARESAWRSRDFQAFVLSLSADPRPIVVAIAEPVHGETAWALRQYLVGRPMDLVADFPLPGFAPVTGDCIEVTVDAPALGRCATVVQAPR